MTITRMKQSPHFGMIYFKMLSEIIEIYSENMFKYYKKTLIFVDVDLIDMLIIETILKSDKT